MYIHNKQCVQLSDYYHTVEQSYGSNWEWNKKGEASEGNLAVEITRSGTQLNMFRSGTQRYAKKCEESKIAKF